MLRRKDISNDLKEAIVAAHQSGKGYKAISKQIGVHYSTERDYFSQVENIQDSLQSSQEGTSQQVHPKVRLCNPQRNCRKPKSYISDATGLS